MAAVVDVVFVAVEADDLYRVRGHHDHIHGLAAAVRVWGTGGPVGHRVVLKAVRHLGLPTAGPLHDPGHGRRSIDRVEA